MANKHYVVLVHGTWGYEDHPDVQPWYAIDSEFASALRKQLVDGSEVGEDWEVIGFTWPECENKHEHRIKAAEKLVALIMLLRRSDPDRGLNFVAHSHGGNVLLEALSQYFLAIHARGYSAFSSALEQIKKDRPRSTEPFSKAPTREELVRVFRTEELFSLAPADALERLSSVPATTPVWLSWKERLRDLVRDFDIGVLNSIDRDITRQRVWSGAAADLWASDPAGHALGRLVFLGTPFYHKRWNCNRSGIGRALEKIGRVTLVVLGLLFYATVLDLLLYVILVLVAAIFVGWRWHPVEWHIAVIMLAAVLATIPWLAILPQIPRAIRARAFYDTNVYFDWGREYLRRVSEALKMQGRIRCLVVSAGLLDEALLGLSAKPVVEGVFRPQLREWLGLEPKGRGGEPSTRSVAVSAIGIDWGVDTGLIVKGLLGRAFKALLFLPWKGLKILWRSLLAPVLETQTLVTVRRVAEMIATGLPAHVLRSATVDVDPNIGVDGVFEQHSWNVTERSFSVVPFQRVQREGDRFAFLLAGHDLPSVDEERHLLYKALSERAPLEDRDQQTVQLLQTALAIDERVGEAKRSVGLVHSTYYGDEEVIRGAAEFLLTGRPPAGSAAGRFP